MGDRVVVRISESSDAIVKDFAVSKGIDKGEAIDKLLSTAASRKKALAEYAAKQPKTPRVRKAKAEKAAKKARAKKAVKPAAKKGKRAAAPKAAPRQKRSPKVLPPKITPPVIASDEVFDDSEE